MKKEIEHDFTSEITCPYCGYKDRDCGDIGGSDGYSGADNDLGEQDCGHYWIELDNGLIIDATGDQFNKKLGTNMPKVYIGELPENYQIEDWN